MAGRKLRRSEEEPARLGALLVVRGGGRCLLLVGSKGGFQRVAGTSVNGSGRLVWAAEVCAAFCRWIDFWQKKGDDCLLWGVWSVRGVGGKVERGWKGGCPASVWAEFGRMRWTEVRGISERIRDGFWLSFGWIQARSWAVSAREGREGLQEASAKLGEEFWRIFGGV